MNTFLNKIYGGSDDLLEVDGPNISDESCKMDGPFHVSCSDGTRAVFTYNGEWKCEVKNKGSLFVEVIQSVGDDGKHTGNAESCTPYSDVLIVREPLSYICVNRKYFRPVR